MIQPWFLSARLGIFVHWGIYAVNGQEASWSFFNHEYRGASRRETQPYETYMAQAAQFTAARYDPRAWAKLFRRAGATYAVLTAKHHDGVALWPTAVSPLSADKATPAGRDLVGPFVEAMRAEGLKVGLYYSHLDWSHPDYASVWKNNLPHETNPPGARFSYPVRRREDQAAWERFLAFHRAQLTELCTRYRPDLLWFDGDWERTAEQWRSEELAAYLRALCPEVVLNNRLGGAEGDYFTPEQGQPITPPPGPWEFCVTMNQQWGYTPDQGQYKRAEHLTRMVAECGALGGNVLLNVGPDAEGALPETAVGRLEQMGAWMGRNAEALYEVLPGVPATHFYGPSTLSRDRRTLYVFVLDRPWGEVAVKGIRNKVRRARVVGTGEVAGHRTEGGAPWAPGGGVPGVLWVAVPEKACDPLGTVVALELDGALDLYSGAGVVVTTN